MVVQGFRFVEFLFRFLRTLPSQKFVAGAKPCEFHAGSCIILLFRRKPIQLSPGEAMHSSRKAN